MASGEVRKKPTKDDSSDSEDGTVTKSPPKKIRKQAKKGRGSIEKPKQKKSRPSQTEKQRSKAVKLIHSLNDSRRILGRALDRAQKHIKSMDQLLSDLGNSPVVRDEPQPAHQADEADHSPAETKEPDFGLSKGRIKKKEAMTEQSPQPASTAPASVRSPSVDSEGNIHDVAQDDDDIQKVEEGPLGTIDSIEPGAFRPSESPLSTLASMETPSIAPSESEDREETFAEGKTLLEYYDEYEKLHEEVSMAIRERTLRQSDIRSIRLEEMRERLAVEQARLEN